MTSYDAIVVGAGHNGMTAATVLAKNGRRVLLVEAADEPGGMARTVELSPGFKVSQVAHLVNRLNPEVVKFLELEKHGLALQDSTVPTVCLSEAGNHLILHGAYGATADGLNTVDSPAWQELRRRLLFQSGLLQRFINTTPLQPGSAPRGQKLLAVKTALQLKLSGKEEIRQLLRMILMCAADVADETLGDDRLKGLLSFDATLGVHLGPRSPTSLLGLYYRLAGEVDGKHGAQAVPGGGMGTVMEAFQAAARDAGVSFRLGCPVARIVVANGRAAGIVTAEGEEISADCVVSAISPVTTFMQLVGPHELDTGFVRDIRSIRSRGNVSRLNLALDRVPDFNGLMPDMHTARMVWAPSIDHVERGFNPSKYGEMTDEPCFELLIPSASDSSMAPAGASSISIAIQNTPCELKQGWNASSRHHLQETVLRQLEHLSPGIGRSIVASDLLTPVDIEAACRAPGGHWHHGELQVDRMFALRPVFGAAHYRSPVGNLYICGAGTHPGGGICGASGLGAAREVIADDTDN